MEKNKPLCIYHSHCADGFTSAWVVNKFFDGEVDFYPGVHMEDPPNVEGRHVIFVDFSYKKPVIEKMKEQALSILILDHHKSAMEDLGDYPKAFENWEAHLCDVVSNMVNDYPPNEPRVLFDMERSGAGITWDFFFDDERRPLLIDVVEDRDLWRFKLYGTREIQSVIFSYPYDFETWDFLKNQCENDYETLYREGEAIERHKNKLINEYIEIGKHRMVIGGLDIPALNMPYFWSSDACNIMAENELFAVCYWDGPEKRTFSLRSREDGLDVQEIAAKYGGGGHKHAAGFSMPRGWDGDIKDWDSLKKTVEKYQ